MGRVVCWWHVASTEYSVSVLYGTIKCSNMTTFYLPAIQRAYVSSSTPYLSIALKCVGLNCMPKSWCKFLIITLYKPVWSISSLIQKSSFLWHSMSPSKLKSSCFPWEMLRISETVWDDGSSKCYRWWLHESDMDDTSALLPLMEPRSRKTYMIQSRG